MAQDKRVIPYPSPGIRRPQIANRLNVLHFQGKPLLVVLNHTNYSKKITLKAHPEICHGEKLIARWDNNDNDVPRNLHQYRLEKILIPGIVNTLELQADKVWLDTDLLQVEIPANLPIISSRKFHRQEGISSTRAEISQNSVRFSGDLIDFSSTAIRLKLNRSNQQSFCWFMPDQDILLSLYQEEELVFSGPVYVARDDGKLDTRSVVVMPMECQAPRYQPRQERTKRFSIHPSPEILFCHPLSGAKTCLMVKDISALGFAVREKVDRSILIPGLILDNIELNVFGTFFIRFSGQVVYRREEDDEVVCGITIINIDVNEHFRLIGLVHQTENENAFVRLNHDPEKFFEFLFDTGFLYPSKYEEVHAHKESFLRAYQKLYLNENPVARCFVYVENGEIYGHVSALRIYRHAWLDHHHAALTKGRSGLRVLRQLSDFHSDVHVLNPWQMRYTVGIWRPNNDFPAKIFGKLATSLNNPSICSLDTFSYMRSSLDTCRNWDDLKGPWEVARATKQDMYEFQAYYDSVSGGLLCEAFDLTVEGFQDRSVAEEYERHGLRRERFLYAVRYGLELKALVEVQESDTGLNLSELTSAVYIYILDSKMVTPRILEFIQCMTAVKHQRNKMTVMIYPNTYVEEYQMDVAKEYTIWILKLNSEGLDAYMKHLSRWCK